MIGRFRDSGLFCLISDALSLQDYTLPFVGPPTLLRNHASSLRARCLSLRPKSWRKDTFYPSSAHLLFCVIARLHRTMVAEALACLGNCAFAPITQLCSYSVCQVVKRPIGRLRYCVFAYLAKQASTYLSKRPNDINTLDYNPFVQLESVSHLLIRVVTQLRICPFGCHSILQGFHDYCVCVFKGRGG